MAGRVFTIFQSGRHDAEWSATRADRPSLALVRDVIVPASQRTALSKPDFHGPKRGDDAMRSRLPGCLVQHLNRKRVSRTDAARPQRVSKPRIKVVLPLEIARCALAG